MTTLQLPEIVPQDELQSWRAGLPKSVAKHCPEEVKQFIEAVAKKLPDFQQYQKFNSMISGEELLLCGMKEIHGETVRDWKMYPLPVPRMQAVDHITAMHRIFCKRGKQGLIDYVNARVKGTELERLLEILNVHVFHQERQEFRRVMDDIRQAKKLESQIQD